MSTPVVTPEPHHEGMLPVVDGVDVAQREDIHKLRPGAVGLVGVLFLTVTGSAPISAMLFNTPISVGFGNGIGTPAGFLIAAVVLTIFGVGYVAMARKVTTAGGFYSFISHGLNRELGMATGFLMVVAYSVFEVSLVGGFAYFASLKAQRYGIHIGWYWWGFAHDRGDLRSGLLRGQAVLADPRRRPDVGGRHADRLRHRHVRQRARVRQCDQSGQRVQEPARGAFRVHGAGRRRRRDRHLLRLLVLGGLGDGAQLRRGVQGPAPQCAPCAVHLGHRPGDLLHADLVGGDQRLQPLLRRRQHGPEQLGGVLLHPRPALLRAVPQGLPELVHHHRLLRLRHGLPQHDRALHVLARSREDPAPGAWAAPIPSTPARTWPPTSSR